MRNGADAKLEELKAEQAEAGCVLEALDIPADSAINVQENRVELYVTDRARFDAALREAGLRLPDHVAVIEVERLAEPATGAAPGGEALDDAASGDEGPDDTAHDDKGSFVPPSSGTGISASGADGSPSGGGDSGDGSGGSGGSGRGGTADNKGGIIGNAAGGISVLLPATGGLPLAVLTRDSC